jgi:uncharacterized protein YqiB (DUF1249 family)
MLGDDLCAVSWRARPGTFVGLMTLYESNYIRLGWLVGDLCALDGEHRSRVDGDVELKLTVLERGPYTTTLALTYVFGGDAGAGSRTVDDPDLEIRVYHDARLAEARTDAARPAHPGLRRLRERAAREAEDSALGHRWARNMMLNKWLEYCADRGHRFGATRA